MNKDKLMKKKIDPRQLTPIQRAVALEGGTEPPFNNDYWDNHDHGLYVDILDGKALFTSEDKFDSGCGWPSFTKPIVETSILERSDYSHGMVRVEVRSQDSDIHLGHVFEDGPLDKGGLRYCINSASLKFIPFDELDNLGYGDYKKYFKKTKGK
jgi:methionine-R-sulfoxide reductase